MPEPMDIDGMMKLISAIVVQAANDYAANESHLDWHDSGEFLANAGILGRVDEIVRYAPPRYAGRNRRPQPARSVARIAAR